MTTWYLRSNNWQHAISSSIGVDWFGDENRLCNTVPEVPLVVEVSVVYAVLPEILGYSISTLTRV